MDGHEYFWGEELERLAIEQLRSPDRLLCGRVTYAGMAAHWPMAQGAVADLMNNIPKVVFSRTLKKPRWANTWLVSENAGAAVRDLQKQDERDTSLSSAAPPPQKNADK